jgi:hypothetical protein
MPKPDLVKKHTTVIITIEMLDALGPCRPGREAWQDLLPAKLSTDPLENLDLALEMIERDRVRINKWDDARWLAAHLCNVAVWPDSDYYTVSPGNINADNERVDCGESFDGFLIAQYLAWAADAIATKEGR